MFFKRPLYPANTSTVVTVYDAETGSIAPIWNDRAGADPRSNPGAIWQEGQIKFYANAGRYNIVASNGPDSKVWEDVIIIDPDAGGGGGGGATDFTDLGDVPSSYAGHAGKAVRVNSGATGLEFYTPSTSYPLVNPCASFVFDDAFSSQISLASQFESRGVRMGLAVNTFGGTGKMSQAQALVLQSSGHEIINHGLNHLDMRDGTSVAFTSAVSEIDGHRSTLVSAGFNINGFTCPYSSTKREFGPIIRKSHDYSFNFYMTGDYAGADPSLGTIYVPMPRHGLHRVSLYSHTLQQSKDIIDYCVANRRSVVFYDHDPSQVYHPASRTESEILEIVDYAINAGLSVVTPSQMLSTNTTIEGSNVFVCRPSSFSVPNETFTTVFMSESVEDANLRVDTSGMFTCKKTGTYRVLMNVEMAVSAEFRILSGMSFHGGSPVRYRRATFATARRPWDTDPTTGNKFAGMAELDTTVWLVAGETFTLRVWQESGGSINTVAGAVESVYGWVLVSPCTSVA